jgi:Sulfotransferase family
LDARNNVIEASRADRLDRWDDCHHTAPAPIASASTVPRDRRSGVSVQAAALSMVDAVASRLGLLQRNLRADELLRAACRHADSDDFGDTSFLDPLQLLLDACLEEASLSVVGRLALRWDTARFLINLLQLRAAERRVPAITRQPIERPIFITGLPRSGTTFLHRLMMADPENRAPLVWQTVYPYPPRTGPDRRAARVAQQLRTFERLAPQFRGLHPLFATSPQECTEITAHSFRSLRFDTTYRIPSYRTWLDAAGHVPAYQFHKRFLQHLQFQNAVVGTAAGHWVLKCPDHVFALEAIRTVYKDARLVFVHRDPVSVLLSVARLTEVVRRPFTRRLDPIEIGRQESARWLDGARRMMDAEPTLKLAEPICHVHHLDLITDPLATVESVYRHFGLTLSLDAGARLDRMVGQQPDGGYAPHAYRFEDHGLDAMAERAKFRDYMVRFGIQPEAPPHRTAAAALSGSGVAASAATRTPSG